MATNAYDEIVKKYQPSVPKDTSTPTPTPTPQPKGSAKPAKTVSAAPAALNTPSPYDAIVSKYQPTLQPDPNTREGTVRIREEADRKAAEAEAAWENRPWYKKAGSYIADVFGPSNIGKTAKAVASGEISHGDALETSAAVGEGILDFGPTVLNAISGISQKTMNYFTNPIIKGLSGSNAPEKVAAVPKPSTLLREGDYGYQNDSDISGALREATTQGLAYQGGTAAVGRIGGLSSGLLKEVLGDVIGGQLVLDPDTAAKDRAKQAAFDAAFGVASEAGSKIIKGAGSAIAGGRRGTAEALEQAAEQATKEAVPGSASAEVAAPKENQLIYKPKKSLGTDAKGQKILGKTEFDHETGNAIVYFDKSLEKNPKLKQQVLDHEYGHVLDKRLNRGSNLSSEIQNYGGNKASLDQTFGDFATFNGSTPEELSNKIAQEVLNLSGGNGSSAAEQFANAIAAIRKSPEQAVKEAPVLTGFLDFVKVDQVLPAPRFTERVVTAKTLKNAADEVAAPKIPDSQRYASIPEKQILTEDVLKQTKGKPYQGIKPENIVHFNQGTQPRVTLIVNKGDKELITIASRLESARATSAAKAEARADIRRIAAERKISEAEARASAKAAYEHYKEVARSVREKNAPVLYNTIAKETADRAKTQAIKQTLTEVSLKQNTKPKPTLAGPAAALQKVADTVQTPTLKKIAGRVVEFAQAGNTQGLQELRQQFQEIMTRLPKDSTVTHEAQQVMQQIDRAIDVSQETAKAAAETTKQVGKKGVAIYDDNRILLDSVPPQKEGTVRIYTTNRPMKANQHVDTDLELQVTRGTANEPKYVADIPVSQADKFLNETDAARMKQGEFTLKQDIPDEYIVFNTSNDATGAPAKLEVGDQAKPKKVKVEQPAGPEGEGTIAATGLDTGKTVKTKSFNPRSINAPEDVQKLFDDLGTSNKEFSDQRISKSNEDIKDLSRMVGLTEEQLINSRPGSIANAETVTAARQLVLDKATQLNNALKEINPNTATPEQLQDFKKKLLELVAMQKSVAGFRTEASNVFRSLGVKLQAGENATLAELMGSLQKNGLANEVDMSAFANKVAKQLELTKGQKVAQGALATWYSSILSGPKTTVRNILSTGSNIVTEMAAAAANPKRFKELPDMVSGLFRGLKQGWGEAKQVLKGAEPGGTKFMDTSKEALQPEVFSGKWKTYGQVVESVGRFLNAQDRFLSSGAREMERSALKVAHPDLSDRLSEALSNAYAERTVYHGKPTGRLIGAVRDSAQTLRRKFPESKIIIPFVDTVANVLDRQFDYIPVFSALRLTDKNIMRQVEQIAKDFNITSDADKMVIRQRLRDQQVGRLVLGTAVGGAAIALAKEGRISGAGPTSIAERKQLEANGWRPNSIKIGDTWVPYTYLGPLAGLLSMAGNVYDKTYYDQAPNKDVQTLVTKGLTGWMQTQLSQSFLSGVSDLFDTVSGGKDPQSYITNLMAGLVPIPKAYTQTKEIISNLGGEGTTYEARSIPDRIRRDLGLTGGLEPQLDAFGRPVKTDLIYGVTPKKAGTDEVLNFLNDRQIVVSKPAFNQQYTVGKEKRRMDEKQYTKYVQESGKQIYQAINRDLHYLSELTPEEAKQEIQSISERIRQDVRDDIFYQ